MRFCNCSMFCCALLCVHSSFVIISMEKRELIALLCLFVFLVSRDCCVAFPHDTTGLSAVCDCGISYSYSLTILNAFSASTKKQIRLICQGNATTNQNYN